MDLMLKHLKLLKQSLPDKVSVRIYTVSTKILESYILIKLTDYKELFLQGNMEGFHGSHTKIMVTDTAGFIGIIIKQLN